MFPRDEDKRDLNAIETVVCFCFIVKMKDNI